jgi:dTDP-4-dehydrorhamnose reductase
MRIVLTGSKGQLAHDVGDRLGLGNEVRGVDLPEVDITRQESVREWMEGFRPQVVVNCAAFTQVDACETDRDLAFAVNAGGPGILADESKRVGAYLVHISTDYVFDGHRQVPKAYFETDPTGPLSWYGRTKLEGEQRVLNSGVSAAILRTAWLYGRKGKNFPKTMLRLALRNPERELKVVDDQQGSPTWSWRLAEEIEAVIEARAEGIFHATADGHTDWYNFARSFLEAMEVPFRMRPCPTSEYPTPAQRPANSILENSRLKALGLNRFVDWRVDLQEFVCRYRAELIEEARL